MICGAARPSLSRLAFASAWRGSVEFRKSMASWAAAVIE